MKSFIPYLIQFIAMIILNIFSIIKIISDLIMNKSKQESSTHSRTIIIASFISL